MFDIVILGVQRMVLLFKPQYQWAIQGKSNNFLS